MAHRLKLNFRPYPDAEIAIARLCIEEWIVVLQRTKACNPVFGDFLQEHDIRIFCGNEIDQALILPVVRKHVGMQQFQVC